MERHIDGGMSLNERLAELGLFGQWDDAAKRRDRDEMIMIMKKIGMDDGPARQTVDTILAKPELYGF